MLQKKLIGIGVASVMLSSCSLFNWSPAPLRIEASEPDAKIYVNGEYVGDGIVETHVPRRTYVSVAAEKKGFKTVQMELPWCPSVLGTIDIISGIIWYVPWIGLFSPGAYAVDPENVAITLEKE